jgi:hypothetical protein
MLASKHDNFDERYPERFPWQRLDSIHAGAIAIGIAHMIDRDLESKERTFVPGLRLALKYIADQEKLEE